MFAFGTVVPRSAPFNNMSLLLNLSASMRFGGFLVALALLGLILVNGALMVLWPKKWLRLPPYIGFQGVFLRKPPSPGGRYVEIRLVGCLVFGIVSWMLVGIIGGDESDRYLTLLLTSPGGSHVVRTVTCLATCLGAATCGGLMLFNPRWFVDKYVRHRNNVSHNPSSALLLAIRLLSPLIIVPAVYLFLNCLIATR